MDFSMVVYGETLFSTPLIHPLAMSLLGTSSKSPPMVARLSSIQRQLAEQMPPCGEGMRPAVKCLHGSQMLSEDTIAAMLPEEVGGCGRDGGWKNVFFHGIETWDL